MNTVYVERELKLPHGPSIWVDGNSKVTVGNGTFAEPTPNCFSLIAIDDCPGSTEVCRTECYVATLKEEEPELFRKYEHNSAVMHALLESRERPQGGCIVLAPEAIAAAQTLAKYIRESASEGFRWHVSGDVFSAEYAVWISHVVKASTSVRHWIYTRSFQWVHHFQANANLTVNLSSDTDNYDAAMLAAVAYGYRICHMTVDGAIPTLPNDSVIFPSYDLRGRDLDNPLDAPWWGTLTPAQKRQVCPPDFFGQSESSRCGPCSKCIKPSANLVTLSAERRA